MIEDFSYLVQFAFILVCLISILIFFYASRSKIFVLYSLAWLLIQSIIAFSGLYLNFNSFPPRMMLFGLLPSLIFLISLFFLKNGKLFIEQIDLQILTYIHTVRLPIEIILFLLFRAELMSIYVTLEGTNFDIITGISAPVIALISFKKRKILKKTLLIWNFLGLLLLINVIVTAVLSAPSTIQMIAFNQPNIAILYFPFNFLPSYIAPLMLFSHLVAIKKLTFNVSESKL